MDGLKLSSESEEQQDGLEPRAKDEPDDSIGSESTNDGLSSPGAEENRASDRQRWSFYRQHRYDIKKPGPTYFFHETDSDEQVSNSESSDTLMIHIGRSAVIKKE